MERVLVTRMLKVIELGFGRSGTMSLKAALEQLGFGPCYHFSDMFHRPGDPAVWGAAHRGEAVDWERLFQGYQSTVYVTPGMDFTPLLERYPEAKLILTTRDPVSWHRSYLDTVYKYNHLTPSLRLKLKLAGLFKPFPRQLYATWDLQERTLFNGVFAGRFTDQDFVVKTYLEQIEAIKAKAPAGRLLVYNIKEGWETLCPHLGVPIPDTPFPHANDTASFIEWRTGKRKK